MNNALENEIALWYNRSSDVSFELGQKYRPHVGYLLSELEAARQELAQIKAASVQVEKPAERKKRELHPG